MVSDLGGTSTTPRVWLMYAASYLFRTGSVRWAIDPVRLTQRVPEAPAIDYARDLGGLSFVLLTHSHRDHLDLELIRRLSHHAIAWVVPEAMVKCVQKGAGLPARQMIVPHPLRPIELCGIQITPFEAMHWNAGHGVPEMGYLAEFGGKRWLFPGDTRRYDASTLPDLGPVDSLFAHTWLGRGSAMQDDPPLLEPFCRWCVGLRASRVVLTHLDEFGRGPGSIWSTEHAVLIAARLRQLQPAVDVVSLITGHGILL